MVNSRRKGSKNERKIAYWFKEWTGYDFARTPSSGGLRWKGMDTVIGDIVCTDKEHSLIFPFSIECKVRDDISFEHLLLDVKSEIREFWDQCTRDSERGSKLPLLFMRYKNMPSDVYFIVMNIKTYRKIVTLINTIHGKILYKKGDYNLIILHSSDLKNTEYSKILIKLMKNRE